MQSLGGEIAGSNSSIFIFPWHFCAVFNPKVTVLLEYLDPATYKTIVFFNVKNRQ